MNNDKRHYLYTAKNIEKLLGISSNILYHWIQVRRLVKPAVEGYGRGKVHKFDVDNLATLLLTKVLHSYRIELWVIEQLYKKILAPRTKFKGVSRGRIMPDKKNLNVWNFYRIAPDVHKREGYFLLISIPIDGNIEKMNYDIENIKGVMRKIGFISGTEQLVDAVLKSHRGPEELLSTILELPKERNYMSFILVDLVAIIRILEVIIGGKF